MQPKIPRDFLIVIPARYKSSRFPGKPLVDIAGKPMIIRTAEQCLKVAERDQVVVATDSDQVRELCERYEIRVEMTREDHQTGGDRVAEVAQRYPGFKFINIQGDEPVFDPDDILAMVAAALEKPNRTLIGYCSMTEEEWGDSKNLKLLFGLRNQLIYIGRGRVPGSHSGKFNFAYRQVCIYVYYFDDLVEFSKYGGRSPLEQVEDNEVMRFLELGIPVEVVKLSDHSISVDRPEDVAKVLARIEQSGSLWR